MNCLLLGRGRDKPLKRQDLQVRNARQKLERSIGKRKS